MNLEQLLIFANILQSLIILITLLANIPQWLIILRRKDSGNLSVSSWIMWFLGSLFALFYAGVNHCVYQNNLSLLITSAITLICNSYTIYLIRKYRKPVPGRNFEE